MSALESLPMKSLRQRPIAGLTLLEVLVSLVIVSIVLVALVELENRDIRALSHCRKMTTAAMLARNMMSQIEVQGFPEDLGEEEGDFKESEEKEELRASYADFRWKKTVEAVRFGDMSFDNARKVTITILWNEGNEQRNLNVVHYLARRGEKT